MKREGLDVNRPLKFMAWDRERKEMLPVKLMDFAEWWVSCDPTYGKAKPLEYGERNSFANEETDRHVLLEFTGLLDRDEKEAYEGHIVHQFMEVCIVRRCVGGFECEIIAGYHEGRTFSFSWLISRHCEIIGHVFENPEMVGDPRRG